MAAPFEGVRVLDFTQGIAGPMATMHLADMGAEVLKVEAPGGDRYAAHPGYVCWSRNKRRLKLDLAKYEGLSRARELIAGADVAVFDSAPSELERLGLDATTLLAQHPALLHAWLPAYGTKGRWSQLPPDDALLTAVTGLSFMQFSYADQPVHLVTPQASYGQGMVAAAALASALYEQRRTGLGQAVVVSGLHGMSAIESGGAIRTDEVIRFGNSSSRGGAPHYRLYRCADDQWFFLGTLTPQFFFRALEAMDLLDLMAEPGIEGDFTNLMRPPGNALAMERLDARIAEKPREEWLRILHDHGVPRGPVGRREGWFAGETVAANDMRIELEHPKLGTVEMPGVSVKLSETAGGVRALLEDGEEWESRVASLESRVLDVESPVPPFPGRTQPPASDPEPAVASGGPLAGVVVLDLGAFIAGTFAPTLMANFGADVIKVEPPEGDPFRTYGLGFVGWNRGKRSLSIDLKRPEGLEIFMEMVKQSDVVLDNYRVGVRERLGIDYASLAAVNPRIISCSVTGYGPTGPLCEDPGFDPLMQARSGMMAAQGGDDEPVFYQIPVNDSATAIMAVFGMVAALNAREETGRGQNVETSLANQSVLCQSGELTRWEGSPLPPDGGRDCLGVAALNRLYECADGWLALSCSTEEQFHQLCVALGHTEWAGRMTAVKALAEPRDGTLATTIAETFAAMERADVIDRLLTRGVPVAPAIRTEDIFADPWLGANGLLEQYDHPQFGEITGVRGYGEFSRTPGGFARRAPFVGEHTREVLAQFGVDEGRIGALLAAGVVCENLPG